MEPDLRDRLAARIARENSDKSFEEAREIVDETAKFLAVCSVFPGQCAPSRKVDVGWHTFILFTRDYAAFCEQNFGRFIHHQPKNDPSDPGPTAQETTVLMQRVGIKANPELWPVGVDACGDVCCCE